MPGGIIHVYQRYDPRRFPSPTQPSPDVVSSAFEHMLTFGRQRELTPEELARVTARIPDLLVQLTAAGNRHEVVTRLVTDMADGATRRPGRHSTRASAGELRLSVIP